MHIRDNVRQYSASPRRQSDSSSEQLQQRLLSIAADSPEPLQQRDAIAAKPAPATKYRFPPRGRDHNALTVSLPPPPAWGLWETVRYTLYGSVSWARRARASTYKADLCATMDLLSANGLVRSKLPVVRVSERYLQKAEIKRQLWWLSDAQVSRLAKCLSDAHDAKQVDIALLTEQVHRALFPGIPYAP